MYSRKYRVPIASSHYLIATFSGRAHTHSRVHYRYLVALSAYRYKILHT